MESVTNPVKAQYQSIPGVPGTAASYAQVPGGLIRNVNSIPLFRRFGSLVGLAVTVSLLAFVAGRAGIIERENGFRVSHLYPALPRKLHEARHFKFSNYPSLSRPLHSSYGSRLNPDSFISESVVHSDASSTLEDFTLDERVPTRQCGRRRVCRARLTVVKEGSAVVIKAGYYIYTKDGKVRTVDRGTRSRLRKTTTKQARNWASKLLSGASARLAEVNCTVSVNDIAEAILDGKDGVLTCPKTGDSRCDALKTIGECTIPEAKEVDPCTEFVKSSAGVDSFAELQVECPTAKFMYNRVGVSLPFCTTECSSNPGVAHNVYLDFYLQSNLPSENKADCLSATLIPAYQYFAQTVLACDSVPPGHASEGRVIIDLANSYQGTAPKELVDAAESHGCTFTYAYYVGSGSSVEDIVNASCAAE